MNNMPGVSNNTTMDENCKSIFDDLRQDVMIVGEPSLMGGEMDDEDERYITRIENTQYDPNSVGGASHHPSPYLSPTHQMPPGFIPQPGQQNPNLQSLLHQKQPFHPNSPLVHPTQVKREQMIFPGSPQQQQPLPSMFSSVGPPTPNTSSNVFPPPPSSSMPLNGDSSTSGKRIPTTPGNPSTITTNNSSNSPPTPSSTNHNQVSLDLHDLFLFICFVF